MGVSWPENAASPNGAAFLFIYYLFFMPEFTFDEWYNMVDAKIIMRWIVEHNEDVEAMDLINKTVFPFSSKFSKRTNAGNLNKNGV